MNVIKIETAKIRKQVASFHQDDRNRAEIMNQLSDHIWNSNLEDVVSATSLTKVTLMKIAYGNTQWPRPKTMFTLLHYFKLRMILVSAKKG